MRETKIGIEVWTYGGSMSRLVWQGGLHGVCVDRTEYHYRRTDRSSDAKYPEGGEWNKHSDQFMDVKSLEKDQSN